MSKLHYLLLPLLTLLPLPTTNTATHYVAGKAVGKTQKALQTRLQTTAHRKDYVAKLAKSKKTKSGANKSKIQSNTFTKSNYRENLIKKTSINPGPNTHAHHIFPIKHQEKFLKQGINIHDPQYLSWWKAKPHQQAAKAYNAEWARFFGKKNNPSKEQILKEAARLMQKYKT